MLEHGGQLRKAAEHYGIPLADWLDLSTGINPHPYVPPQVPLAVWMHLPQEHDGLEQAAAAYYSTADLLPVAGSQAAIQALPRLREKSRVGVLHPGYAEHAHAWHNAGHDVVEVNESDVQLDDLDVLVLMNPNNPTGATFTYEQLRDWHAQLTKRSGWLIVDEAFIDATPQASIARALMPQGLIVLRSLGKFFGLAGARMGFVAAHPFLLDTLRDLLGPWHLSGPSRFVAQAALRDGAWHAAMRERLLQDESRLVQLLRDVEIPPAGGCSLFQWVVNECAADLHQHLAQHGILTRLFAQPDSLRFGLPGSESDWQRLSAALEQVRAR